MKYTTNYIADKNGYRAYGAHLPTQPDEIHEPVQIPQEPPLPPLFVQKPKPIIVQRPPYISSTPAPRPQTEQVIYYPVRHQQVYVTRPTPPSYIHVTPKPQFFVQPPRVSTDQPLNVVHPFNYVVTHNYGGFSSTPSPYSSYN